MRIQTVIRYLLVGLICWVSAAWSLPGWADYSVCGLDLTEFKEMAYSDSLGNTSSEMLVKWQTQPNLMVLSRSIDVDLTADLQGLQSVINRNDFWRNVKISYLRYADLKEVPGLVTGIPRNTVFVFIDDTNFDTSVPFSEDMHHALRVILVFDNMVDNLIGDARDKSGRQHVTRNIVNLGTGEVVASASLVKSTLGRRTVLAAVFMSLAEAVSPTFASDPTSTKRLFSWSEYLELTPAGVSYFKTIADECVEVGTPKSFFSACSN